MDTIKTLTLWAIALMPICLFSQNNMPTSKDLIQVKTSMSNPKFYVNSERVRLNTAQKYIASNPEALIYFKKGKTKLIIDDIGGFIGGLGFGWQVGRFFFNQKVNFTILGSSAGLIGVCLVLHNSANKSFNKAFDIYRDDKIGQTETVKYQYKLGINPEGALAFVVSF